jgi:hypothetical protein
MKLRNRRWPALLAVVVAWGCGRGTTKTIEVHAVAHDGGARVEILKDRAHHDSVVVEPGDRIAFICSDCPQGAEFTVEDIHFLGDLDDVVDALLAAGLTDPARTGALIEGLEATTATTAQPAALAAGLPATDPRLAETATALRSLRAAFPSPPGGGEYEAPRLFDRWTPPGFTRAADRIVTDPVAKLDRTGLWKFTWKVRLAGSEDSWDPHIIGHPDYDG